jgi:ABC-2 type transport system permease protein
MNTFLKCVKVAQISARSHFAYGGETIGRFFFLCSLIFIFTRLWNVTYKQMNTTILGGLSIEQMMLYFVVAEAIILSGPRITQLVDEEVRTGALAVQLVRPLSYPLYKFASTFGERFARFLFVFALAVFILFVFVGKVSLTLPGLLMLACALPLAFSLDFLGCFCIGIFAFWIEDTSGLFLIYSRLVMIFGGMLIPLDLFPQVLQPIIRALPFASMVYGPAHLLVKPDFMACLTLIVNQLVGIAVMLLVLSCLYGAGLRRVSSSGG